MIGNMRFKRLRDQRLQRGFSPLQCQLEQSTGPSAVILIRASVRSIEGKEAPDARKILKF